MSKKDRIRDQFLLDHLWLVEEAVQHVRAKFYKRGVEKSELISIGMLGLMDAYKKYKKEFNIKFTSYAYFRVRGALLDELRLSGFSHRRHTQDLKKEIDESKRLFNKRFKRDPNTQEICKIMNISEKRYHELCLRFSIQFTEFKDYMAPTSKSLSPEERCIHRDITGQIFKLMKTILTKRERFVIVNRYWKYKTQLDIGMELGLSEASINIIEKKARTKLEPIFSIYFLDN